MVGGDWSSKPAGGPPDPHDWEDPDLNEDDDEEEEEEEESEVARARDADFHAEEEEEEEEEDEEVDEEDDEFEASASPIDDDEDFEAAISARLPTAPPAQRKRAAPAPARRAQRGAAQRARTSFVADDSSSDDAADQEEEEEEEWDDGMLQEDDERRPPPARRAPPPAPLPRVKLRIVSRPPSADSLRGSSGAASSGDDSSDDSAEAEQRAAARRRRVAPVLLSPQELAEMGDEVERVIKHRDMEGVPTNPTRPWDSREFYVKWARNSYLHCSWDTLGTLSQLAGFKRVLNYCRRVDEARARRAALSAEERELSDLQAALQEQLEEEHSRVERVVAERGGGGVGGGEDHGYGSSSGPAAGPHYLVKWRGLPYGECTFEAARDVLRVGGGDAIAAWQAREAARAQPRVGVAAARREFAAAGTKALAEQPAFLRGGRLRDYQLDSLNWLSYSWARGVNCILADEMGLGKTVQCAALMGWLALAQRVSGPFLVVVPLSVVPNWVREFDKWVPQLDTVVYVGDAASRQVIREFEFGGGGGAARGAAAAVPAFDVLVTTYEMVIKDAAILRPIRWNYLVVDEAHRLKNEDSALYRELAAWSFKSKLLVTGTPLQNNIRELWALLSFLEPAKFPSAEEFIAKYDTTDSEQVGKLHAILRPHLLRRVIKDVERSLPPKTERILRVGMTPLQKQYYKWILSRNYQELNKGSKAQLTLLNIIMDLKKCCNHPFLFDSAEEIYRRKAQSDMDEASRLVLTSGKMVLLDKLLKRLYESGHRVLVFSQMVRVLDILADYCRLRGYSTQRLDGSTPAQARHAAMEAFNAPGSKDFAFLLSTRAGGLGINLATADTVIIFDSDWNPQNDLQAMSRAHRIGQKDTVNIYRFVTSGSVEEDILERAKAKMVLDHLVIQRMDTSGRTVLGGPQGGQSGTKLFGKDEMAAILRFGAEDLFKEDEAATASQGQALYEEDIDAILARSEVVASAKGAEGGPGAELLGAFNVATFQTSESDAEFWKRLIPESEAAEASQAAQGEEEPGIRTARLRLLEPGGKSLAEEDDNEDGEEGEAPAWNPGPRKKGKAAKAAASVEGAHARISRWPPPVDAAGFAPDQAAVGPPPSGWPSALSKKDATAFLRAARRYLHPGRLAEMAADTGGLLAAAPQDAVRALWFGLRKGCRDAIEAAAAQAGPSPSGSERAPEAHLDFFGVDVKAAEFEHMAVGMFLLNSKLAGAGGRGQPGGFRLEPGETAPQTQWMKACGWGAAQDACLLVGVHRHGIGHWDRLIEDPELGLEPWLVNAVGPPSAEGREAGAAMPKASFLETRVHALLRQLEKMHRRPVKAAPARRPGSASPAPKRAPGSAHPAGKKGAGGPSPLTLEQAETLLGGETMTLVRKLRTLERKGAEMAASLVAMKTKKYLGDVGRRVDEVAGASNDPHLKARLWATVSLFSENKFTGDKLAEEAARLQKP